MELKSAIKCVVDGHDLTFDDMRDVMRTIMAGEATDAQIGGLLVALRMKGEAIDEIAGAASVMRELATKVEVGLSPLLDTCGTGGDGIRTFNISTAAAFVTAAAGGLVAKHGNRSATSSSGSADVLEVAGARLDLKPQEVAACIREVGVGFMFAPAHHGATRHAMGPRRELGARTMFNILGPLTNPASACCQLMGIFDAAWVSRLAAVLKRLGVERALVVCAEDGMDEISIGSVTHAAELRNGSIETYTIDSGDFGIALQPVSALTVDGPQQSLDRITAVFRDEQGPAHDIVALNAGAAIYVGGLADSLQAGVERARQALANASALKTFERFVDFTQKVKSRAAGDSS